MTTRPELYLRLFIRDSIDDASMRDIRSLVRESVHELILEADKDTDWEGLFNELETALGVLGLGASLVLLVPVVAASAGPVLVGVMTTTAIASITISLGQAAYKLTQEDWKGAAFEIFDSILGILSFRLLPPGIASTLRQKAIQVISDIADIVINAIGDYIDSSNTSAAEKIAKKAAAKAAVTAAKAAALVSQGATATVSEITQQDLEDRAIEIAINDSESGMPRRTQDELILEITQSFNNIDQRALNPLESLLHKVYMENYDDAVDTQGASTDNSSTLGTSRRAKQAIQRKVKDLATEPTEFIRDYKYDSQNGDLRWTGEDRYMGEVVGNLYDMKPGDPIPPTGRVKLVSVKIDPRGTSIESVVVKGVDGTLLKVRSMYSRF